MKKNNLRRFFLGIKTSKVNENGAKFWLHYKVINYFVGHRFIPDELLPSSAHFRLNRYKQN